MNESSTLTDPEGLVSFDILRQGTDGEVNVQWRLGAAAVDDFVPPLAGMVHFNAVSMAIFHNICKIISFIQKSKQRISNNKPQYLVIICQLIDV